MSKPCALFRRIKARALVLASPILVLAVSACAIPHDISVGEQWGRARSLTANADDAVRSCIAAFRTIDHAVDLAGTGDAQAAAIPGFPHLRTSRFLAALAPRFRTGRNDKAFAYWIEWLALMATKARGYELANFSSVSRDALRGRLGKKPEEMVSECASVLTAFDMKQPKFRETLARTIAVPDHYTDMFRVIGIYPLMSIPVLIGFGRWKDRNLPGFGRPPGQLKISGKIGYAAPARQTPPMKSHAVAAVLRAAADNPLNIPRPSAADFRRLAASFAPVYAIDVAGGFDRIGVPVPRAGGAPGLDTSAPRVYVQPSWAIINGVPLLQISYLAWFSERPPTSSVDILAGKMDGLIWRVTIAPDGRPLLYDSIHPCGCYHLFFPVPPTRLKDLQIDAPLEGTVVPIDAPVLPPGRRMVLHVDSGNHYLRALSVSKQKTLRPTRYELVAMDGLRSLPAPGGGRRSLYQPNGLVAGSERAERFVLWPMGIISPGAMRQWGTHATAFVGRRHFDDPYLIDKAFTR